MELIRQMQKLELKAEKNVEVIGLNCSTFQHWIKTLPKGVLW